jgi:hypothetical protein
MGRRGRGRWPASAEEEMAPVRFWIEPARASELAA